MWIPLHIGIKSNELSDELATKAARSSDTKIYTDGRYNDAIHVVEIKYIFLYGKIDRKNKPTIITNSNK